jgi:D-arabinitol 2-dehydrogenase
MFRSQIIKQAARAARAPRASFRPAQPIVPFQKHPQRFFATTPVRSDKSSDDEYTSATTSGEPGESGEHEGQYARTSKDIVVEVCHGSEAAAMELFPIVATLHPSSVQTLTSILVS